MPEAVPRQFGPGHHRTHRTLVQRAPLPRGITPFRQPRCLMSACGERGLLSRLEADLGQSQFHLGEHLRNDYILPRGIRMQSVAAVQFGPYRPI